MDFNSSVLVEIERQAGSGVALVELSDHGEALHSWSYDEVLAWAEVVAMKLRVVAKSDFPLIALLLDRSALTVVAILAVWKAGFAYTPVPKDVPAARQRRLCSQADGLLTDRAELLDRHQASLLLDRMPIDGPRLMGHSPVPEDICMVIYTSGSTGAPKGVVCHHRCLWHSVSCFADDIEATSSSRLLWKTPYQWRTAEYELFGSLCFGGRLYVAPEGAQRHFGLLGQICSRWHIDAFTAVPSVLPLLELSVKHVALVGEALPMDLARRHLQTMQLRNYYGLTETAMTTWKCRDVPKQVAPVGRPQEGSKVQLVKGEVHFGGIMSSGYLKQPELTQERYVQVEGETYFRTGDFGAWKDGELELWGRKDAQVKLNGVRIELAEIEASLSAACREAAVVQAVEDAQTLVAFVVGAEDQLREFLLQQLPQYMIPMHFVHLDALPRLANDKVDRVALRAKTLTLQSRSQAEAQLDADPTDEKLLRFLDSLGFERLLSSQQLKLQRLCDNLSVLGMANVILFHWFWCVLVEPQTYLLADGGTTVVPMPQLHVNSWLVYTYRMATQDWAYAVFVFAAAHMTPNKERFLPRDAFLVALYFYTGFFPMILSTCLEQPWSSLVFRAETVQRWFLLALFLGKAAFAAGQWCKAGPWPIIPLLILYLFVPSCFMDFCHKGGEYVLPTEWWPQCSSCLMTPKVMLCSLLYVGFSHFGTACAQLVWKTDAPLGALVFFISCAVSQHLPTAQAAVEGQELEIVEQVLGRAAGLLLILLQAWALAGAIRPLEMHWRWPARYLMGSYLLNLNFLDVFLISPSVRRRVLEREIDLLGSAPMACAICLWITMLLPVVIFMTVAAPVLQRMLITGPFRLLSSLGLASRRGRLSEPLLA